ncbi:MAG: septal ring lytic transglycosylase RlpA family protein [Alsobacter sp.]
MQSPSSPRSSALLRVTLAVGAGLLVANCSSSTQKYASKGGGIDPKYGVSASPKVVADGDPVPKGGGREMVGKPYVVAGRLYTPRENPRYSATGLASWYGPSFHGRLTANGEVFDRASISAAHPTMPLPSYVRVTNLTNNFSIIARVNDRGPYHGGRLIDVSQRVAEALDFRRVGTARVRVDYVGRASTAGSDDEKLYASLRTDGMPAQLRPGTTLVASADGSVPVQSVAFRQPAAEPEVEEAAPAPAPVAAAPVRAAAVAPAAAEVADAAPVGKPAPGVPLPPDRPFDLGAAKATAAPASAHAPVAAPVPMPIPRTAARAGKGGTSLFFAETEPEITSSFRQGDPMAGLIEQTFIPLKPSARF